MPLENCFQASWYADKRLCSPPSRTYKFTEMICMIQCQSIAYYSFNVRSEEVNLVINDLPWLINYPRVVPEMFSSHYRVCRQVVPDMPHTMSTHLRYQTSTIMTDQWFLHLSSMRLQNNRFLATVIMLCDGTKFCYNECSPYDNILNRRDCSLLQIL